MSDRANKTIRIVLAVVVLTNPLAWVLAVLAFNVLLAYVSVSLLVEATRWHLTVRVTRPRRTAAPAPPPLADGRVVDAAPVLIPSPPAGDALAEVGRQFQKAARSRVEAKANKKPKTAVRGKSPKAKGNKAPSTRRREKSPR